MKKIVVCLSLAMCSLQAFSQKMQAPGGFAAAAESPAQRMTLIVLLDNEVANAAQMTSAAIIAKDKAGKVMMEIPLDYHVGYVAMTPSNYNALFSLDKDVTLLVQFKYKEFTDEDVIAHVYEKKLATSWLNDEYLIFKIFNASNAESKAKYYFPANVDYLIQVEMPGTSSILTVNKLHNALMIAEANKKNK